MSRSRPNLSPRSIIPSILGVLILAGVATWSWMTILSNAPLATHSPAATSAPPVSTASAIAVVTPSASAEASASESPTPVATDSPAPSASATESVGPSASPSPEPSTPPAVGTALFSQPDTGGAWRVTLRYPKFDAGLPTAAAMNADLADFIQATAEQWEAGPAADPGDPPHLNTLTSSYSVALLTPRLASFRLEVVDDTGGAHPGTTVSTFTYDVATGKRIAFGDVFVDGQAALAILSDSSRTLLKQSLGADYDAEAASQGTEPTFANFAAWALTKTGLEITFGEYQVGPYAIQRPRIVVPWSAFGQVVNTDGPLGTLVGH